METLNEQHGHCKLLRGKQHVVRGLSYIHVTVESAVTIDSCRSDRSHWSRWARLGHTPTRMQLVLSNEVNIHMRITSMTPARHCCNTKGVEVGKLGAHVGGH